MHADECMAMEETVNIKGQVQFSRFSKLFFFTWSVCHMGGSQGTFCNGFGAVFSREFWTSLDR